MRVLTYLLKIGFISSLALHSITLANATPAISDNQITSVSQLSEIRLDSWEVQTLNSLIEQYNCINNFTHYTNQTLNRYQFATELNTCITQINELISNTNSEIVNRENLTTLQRLKTEFSAELATLENRVDLLENQVATLKAQQFSPQVELEGEIIFAVSGFAGGKKANSSDKPINENLAFSDRVRLSLETSFTGKDEMKLRLQARNTPELAEFTGTQMANLGFDGDDDNEVELDELEYKFPLSQQTRMTLYALGGGLGDFVPSVNPLFSGSGDGSISTFGRENPIRRQGGGAGIGISHNLSDSLNLSLGYVTSDAANPDKGIFANPYGAIAQLTLEPTKTTAISFTYLHSYNNLNTGTGSELTGNPFNDQADAIAANSFGAEAAWQINPNISLGGRVGLIHAKAENLPANPNAVISTWSVLLALTDIGREGSFAGFVVGQPPKVTYHSYGDPFEDQDTSLHLEAFYNFQLTDNLAITPGLFVITNPEHNNSNDKIYVGTVRTTFTF
ncbi:MULTISPECIES: iron uptake porin [unclassified Nodularia (in: cyanobacteria)]|uniref:iron uptake porin n=1 Tax=unclassified Nodularia (in: cyanobacteria) TaxID=2656917 RepID=UPI00187E98F7|nr:MULTISPECIES: iron uptake porin [unclassified Nodularia (in: cyanobacteria)]MBE9198519.1 carbohydrate porin [Nodularia sp. LEGE 06071]MCC2691016.1 carbohydrate porin [Nodularia sp. LEGE 04288]